MIVATAGHIDHGKTSLVKALTGIDTDRLPEEKRRGMTVDLGFAYRRFEEDMVLGFVDVPGHDRFVHTMVAGVGAVDFAVLVVAADDGPMPQTYEHLSILSLLGIERGTIVVTKIDKTGPARAEHVADQVRAGAGSEMWGRAPHFAVSSQSADGICALVDHLVAEARRPCFRRPTRSFRMTVDRVFTIEGAGLVAGGTVVAGEVAGGDRVVVSPHGWPARVRRLHANNREAGIARVGDRCALNLVLQRNGAIRRGDLIVAPDACAPTQRFDAQVKILPASPHAIRSGSSVHLHIGTADLMARVDILGQSALRPGETGLVQVVTERAVDVCRADRFVLRNRSATITLGGGEAIDPWPAVRGRGRPQRLAILRAMASLTPNAAFSRILTVSSRGVDWDAFVRAWNLPDGLAADLANDQPTVELNTSKSRILLGSDKWDALSNAFTGALRRWHAARPDEAGPSRRDLAIALHTIVDRPLLDAVIEKLLNDGAIRRSRTRLYLPGHEPALLQTDRIMWNRLRALYAEHPSKPPTIREIAEHLNIDKSKLENFLDRMAERDYVARVGENRYFLAEHLNELQALARALAAEASDHAFTAAAYRDRCSLGRNLTIELLEYFDRNGFTRLVGGRRYVQRRAAVFGG